MLQEKKSFFEIILNIGACNDDSEALRLKKSSLIIVPLIIGPAAFIWGILYVFLDQYLSASIPLSLFLIYGIFIPVKI